MSLEEPTPRRQRAVIVVGSGVNRYALTAALLAELMMNSRADVLVVQSDAAQSDKEQAAQRMLDEYFVEHPEAKEWSERMQREVLDKVTDHTAALKNMAEQLKAASKPVDELAALAAGLSVKPPRHQIIQDQPWKRRRKEKW